MLKILSAFLLCLSARAQVSFPNPINSGGTLPATCRPGSLVPALFVLTSGTPVTSAQTYQCTAANTWTAIPTSSGGTCASLGGDLGGTCGSGTVLGLTHATWPGSTSQITYNNAAAGAGDQNLTWDASSLLLNAGEVPGVPTPALNAGTPRVQIAADSGASNPTLAIRGSTFFTPWLEFLADDGTLAVPAPIGSGEDLAHIEARGYVSSGTWALASRILMQAADTPSATGVPGLLDLDIYDSDGNKVTVFGARFWAGADPLAQLQIGPEVTFLPGKITMGDGRTGQPTTVDVLAGASQGSADVFEVSSHDDMTQYFRVTTTTAALNSLKTTGAATGKKIVCVDTATGQLYASSSGVACAN